MSNGLTIRQARNTPSRKTFLRLPFDLYRHDPHWVPPLRSAQKKLFACRTAFFDRAEMGLFLAERAGKVVGRVADQALQAFAASQRAPGGLDRRRPAVEARGRKPDRLIQGSGHDGRHHTGPPSGV